jgi:L-arabinonolactonase
VRISHVVGADAPLGESPSWDPIAQVLWYVDIAGRVARYRPADGSVERWSVPAPVFGVVGATGGTATVMFADRFEQLDPMTSARRLIARAPLNPGTGLADLKVDRSGAIVAVSSDAAMAAPTGSLYRLRAGAEVTSITTGGFALGNGPCFSPDGSVLYCSDSARRQIYAFDYSADGELTEGRLFADTRVFGGIPDGATVDADGALWVAMFGAGRIAQYSANGVPLQVIDAPTRWISSVMFGGANLDVLYATSLDPSSMAEREGIVDEIGTTADAAVGRLFAIEGTAARGLPEVLWAVDQHNTASA